MEQLRIGLRRQLAGEFIEPGKDGQQTGLGIGGGQGAHRFVEFNQGLPDRLFRSGHSEG